MIGLLTHARECAYRARYRRAYVRAIDAAAEDGGFWGPSSRADGLRAIRKLESLNGRRFDPLDPVMVSVVRGSGGKVRHIKGGRR